MTPPLIGDTVHATDGHSYTVTQRTNTVAMAERKDRPRQGKLFNFTELEQVKAGVWKEVGIK